MDDNIPKPEMGSGDILILLIAALIMIIPFWRIFSKAGYSGWLSILMVLPIINLILLYFLAFANWPILKSKVNQTTIPPNPPTPPSIT
jgi:hypothetical protein